MKHFVLDGLNVKLLLTQSHLILENRLFGSVMETTGGDLKTGNATIKQSDSSI